MVVGYSLQEWSKSMQAPCPDWADLWVNEETKTEGSTMDIILPVSQLLSFVRYKHLHKKATTTRYDKISVLNHCHAPEDEHV